MTFAFALTILLWFFVMVALFGTAKKKKSPVWLQIVLGLFAGAVFVGIFLLVETGLDILDIFERLLIRLSK